VEVDLAYNNAKAQEPETPIFKQKEEDESNAASTPNDSTPKTVDVKKARSEHFSTLSKADIAKFTEILGEMNVISEADEINPFVKDFTNKYIGIGSVVLTP